MLEAADAGDADGDGISGRPNHVVDVASGGTSLGRFGWKANVPTVEQQVAGAFHGDIGITTPLFPEQNCPPEQTACLAAPNGGTPEVDEAKLDRVTFYTRTLAVPARRDAGAPDTAAGEQVFTDLGCSSCHRPQLTTGQSDVAALSNQVIRPYTDLLLHDMGPGLADGRPDGEATGSEWRTTPLWGIGLTETVSRHTRFLHDGRARNLTEAILWHGGEASCCNRGLQGPQRRRARRPPRLPGVALMRRCILVTAVALVALAACSSDGGGDGEARRRRRRPRARSRRVPSRPPRSTSPRWLPT